VPLAAVLWTGGISFGGVIAFIFADLIVIPILNIYRKYYGGRMSLFLLATSYVAMVIAGFLIEILFGLLGLIPERRDVLAEIGIRTYTTVLNFLFLGVAAFLLIRFFRTGGMAMLKMMNVPETVAESGGHTERAHGHAEHGEHSQTEHGHGEHEHGHAPPHGGHGASHDEHPGHGAHHH
jgi:uncharacterized membrane protein YraQ (UPF0718 family)